jgi:arylsulfatase A-like enzyme
MPRLLAGIAALVLAACVAGQETVSRENGTGSPRPPNIIFIVADDLGYGDVSAFGSKTATPNIDRLARDGARFTDAHVTGTVCSPSRAALMTGRYQSRFGHDVNPVGVSPSEAGLPLTERTIAQRMQAAGYRTGLVGKWHLGYGEGFHPMDRGFDETFGFNASAKFITQPAPGDLIVRVPSNEEGVSTRRQLFRGKEAVSDDGYLTEILNREALSFLDRNKDKPFFLVVTHYATHVPLEATAKYVERVKSIPGEEDRVYAAMTLALDDSVGQIVDRVDSLGLGNDTLIVFISDNGCPAYLNGACTNGPLAGHKRDLREGGHRIATFARWPGVISPGRVVDQPVLSIDFSATALSLAGMDPGADPAIDGRSLAPLLRGTSRTLAHDAVFWRAGANYAVRSGDWKLIVAETPAGAPAELLFNLKDDIGETRNLAAQEPQRVAQLKAAFREFDRTNIPPRFKPRKIEVEIAGQKVLMSY